MSAPLQTPQPHDPSQPPPAPGTTAADPAIRENDLASQRVQHHSVPAVQGRNAFNSERPLGVTPVPEGWPFWTSITLEMLTQFQVASRLAANQTCPRDMPPRATRLLARLRRCVSRSSVVWPHLMSSQVIGKYTYNPELHERGELRETGGKAAAEGRARAAHD